jgi:hypothetical protein
MFVSDSPHTNTTPPQLLYFPCTYFHEPPRTDPCEIHCDSV